MSSAGYIAIEIPFQNRHQCWFCAEPAGTEMKFPRYLSDATACEHPPLRLPSCSECQKIANAQSCFSVWELQNKVKQSLTKRYKKHLAIGVNWTKEELEESEFEDKIFAGFKKSAWFMYEVARDRVNFPGWSVVIDGIELLPPGDIQGFSFDGVDFPSLNAAIEHYAENFDLDKLELKRVVDTVSASRFAFAVQFCRRLKGTNRAYRQQAIRSLGKTGAAYQT